MFTVEQIKSLNELEMQVYQYIIQHKSTVPYMRIRELAAESYVSSTTVLRFCRKMGCDGYNEFKWKLKEQLGQQKSKTVPDNAKEVQMFLEEAEKGRFDRILEDAASMIARADRVLLTGIGNSGCIGQYGARCFTNMGKFSVFISDPFYPIHQLGESTTTIVLSMSGETKEVIDIAKYLKESGSYVISITNTDQCTLAKLSDLNISCFLTNNRGEDQIIDYSTQIPVVYLLESLGRRIGNRLVE